MHTPESPRSRGRIPRRTVCLAVLLLLLAPFSGRSTGDSPSSGRPAAEQDAGLALLPLPAALTPGEGALVIDQRFTVAFDGYRDALLGRAVARLVERLRARTGIPIAPTPIASGPATLQIRCKRLDPAFLTEHADERYTLDVTTGRATIIAPTSTGVLRALATFAQLVRVDGTGVHARAVHIEDAPRFGWRGLMLDVARHFAGRDVLHRTLDAMETVKLNVLHLHLSDNEGFRIESLRYPRLHATPSSGGRFYTRADVRAIVVAARDRGIRVVPEIEMPGHTHSVLIAYPQLGSGPGPYRPGRSMEAMNAALDPTREATYVFIAGLLGEIAQLFPDRAFHVAGDEVTSVHWRQNARIQAFMARRGMATTHELQGYFTKRVAAILRTLGKVPVVWDEALAPDLGRDVMVQAWRSSKMVQRAAAAGHRTIVSAGYYLGHGLPAAKYYAVDPYDSRAMSVPSEVIGRLKGTPLEPFVSEAMVAADAPELTEQDHTLVVGGEAPLWTELVPESGLEMHMWPRAAAIAERLWSPSSVRDVASMYRRLEIVSSDLELQGLQHRWASTLALQRLAAGDAAHPLAVLAGAVEPLQYLGRLAPMLQALMAGHTETAILPMNRLADAVPPESQVARSFNDAAGLVRAGRDNPQPSVALVRAQLTAWRDNDSAVDRLVAGSYLLQEIVPLSRDVRALAETGLEALDAIESGTVLPADRLAALRERLVAYQQAAAASTSVVGALMSPQPAHGLRIAIVSGIADLVEAAGTTASRWAADATRGLAPVRRAVACHRRTGTR